MNQTFLQRALILPPLLLAAAASSCSSPRLAAERREEGRAQEEKREEARFARQMARAEKRETQFQAEASAVLSAPEAPIFLDYPNPEAPMAGDSYGPDGLSDAYAGSALFLPGNELPAAANLTRTQTTAATPVPLPDQQEDFADLLLPPPPLPAATVAVASSPAAPAPVDTDQVRAWASSMSPFIGSSLNEPLLTAAMTAKPLSAAAMTAAEAAPLARAFAGAPSSISATPSSAPKQP